MAKSLRSKTKRAFRSIKRQNVFGPTEEARLQRLASKQASVPTESYPQPKPQEETAAATAATEETETATMEQDPQPLTFATREERDAHFLSRNQFKKKMRAKRAASLVKNRFPSAASKKARKNKK